MATILEQSTTDQVNDVQEPSVSYRVDVTIVASPSGTPGTLNIAAPATIFVPEIPNEAPCLVVWKVVPNGLSSVRFADPNGISFSSPPNGVGSPQPVTGAEDQFQVMISNVSTTESFNYTISVVDPHLNAGKREDPTIVVTPEPIDS